MFYCAGAFGANSAGITAGFELYCRPAGCSIASKFDGHGHIHRLVQAARYTRRSEFVVADQDDSSMPSQNSCVKGLFVIRMHPLNNRP